MVNFKMLNSQVNRCSIKVEGKYGFIDTLGKIAIQPQYERAMQFSEGLAAAKLNGKYGYIDTLGNFVIEPIFQGSEHFKDGFAKVWVKEKQSTKSGVIDRKGEWILKPKYDIVTHMNDGFVGVVKDGKMAFYDLKNKKFITKFEYDHKDCWSFSEGLAMVKIGKYYGFIDTNGKVAIQPIFRQVRSMQFSCGLASVRDEKSGRWGYINRKGENVIDFKFDEAYLFEEQIAWVRDNYGDMWYAMDTAGKRLFDLNVTYSWGYKEGLCGVKMDNKYGIIDLKGNWVVEPVYDWIHVYYGYGWISFFNQIDGVAKWGVLDRNGNEIVPANYLKTLRNDGDCSMVELYEGDCENDVDKCSLGYANTKGEIIWEPRK
jgi:hypothetical protein